MTVALPVLAGYGDIQEASLSRWDGKLLVTVLKHGGELSYRLDGAPLGTTIPLGRGGVWSGPKRGLGTLVSGNLLLVAWEDVVTGMVLFGRWNLVTRTAQLVPASVVEGKSPAMVFYGTTKLAMAFAQEGAHKRILSLDLGDSWFPGPPVEVVTDAGNANIQAVDITTQDSNLNVLKWAETDTPP